MSEDIPRCLEETGFVLQNANGPIFRERSEERAAAWSTIEPNDQRDGGAGLIHIMSHGSEQLIVHATGALGPIPIYLLISFVEEGVPAKDWNRSGSVTLRLLRQKSVVLKVAIAALRRKNSNRIWIYFIFELVSRFILYSSKNNRFFHC